ncbi:MAG: cytochrome c [Steroidobacteraceae bacterium]
MIWAMASAWCCVLLTGQAWAARQPASVPDVNLSSTLARSPNETRGQRIFELHCQQCHQAGAIGSAAQKVPALAGQQYEYLIKQVVDFLDLERENSTMHQQLVRSGMNNATSIADVVGYVANLPRNPAPEKGPGTDLVQGKQIYDSYCVSCHGRTGEGNSDLWVPNLRGQHYSYLLTQMQHMARSQRTNVSEDLHRMFTTYADEEFQAVADYLTRWNP